MKSPQTVVRQPDETIDLKFKVGSGASSGAGGDSYPYQVVSVSKSGKSMRVVPMEHHLVNDPDNVGQKMMVYTCSDEAKSSIGRQITLRKNGRWISKGSSLKEYYLAFYPGAYYKQDPHF